MFWMMYFYKIALTIFLPVSIFYSKNTSTFPCGLIAAAYNHIEGRVLYSSNIFMALQLGIQWFVSYKFFQPFPIETTTFYIKKTGFNTQVSHNLKRATTLTVTLNCVILIVQLPRNNKRLSVQTKTIKKTIFPRAP